MKFNLGDQVRFVEEHLNKMLPDIYPVAGTTGEVTQVNEYFCYAVKFEDGKHILLGGHMVEKVSD